MRTGRLARAIAAPLAAALLLAACSNDGGPVAGGGGASTKEVLTAIADGVIIPSYEALSANLTALDSSLATLCQSPSGDGLSTSRARWRDTELAWESTRAAGVGPAIEQRAMGAIAFRARPDKIEALLAGGGPVDSTSLAQLGSDVRGINAIEVALFGDGSEALDTSAGRRRCTYASSVADLAITASQAVLDAWTGGTDGTGGYRDTFIAGMDGKPTASVASVVNEMAFRLQQIDDQGVRAFAEAATPDDLPASRREGPGSYGVASLRGILGGIVAVVRGPDGDPGLAALVRSRSEGTADRLEDLTTAAVDALRALPDSSAAALADHAAVARAAKAVAALRVLVTTEVASQLGVTIGFSDADGDS
jgi:predicted lipoprotein